MTFFEYLTKLTKTYQTHQFADPALREAYCIQVMSQYQFLPMQKGDLLAGRMRILPVGFSNEPLLGRSVSWFYDEARAMEALQQDGATPEEIAAAKQMLAFWATQETRANLRAQYPADIQAAMPQDIYWEHSQISFPLYRVVGAYMDYEKLLQLGLGGMKDLVERYRRRAEAEGAPTALYEACGIALNALSEVCRTYASQTSDAELKTALQNIGEQPPQTFLEAMQLAWLYSLISGVLNYGRMDVYLGDYLATDLDSGRITLSRAQDLVCSLWHLIDARKTVFHGRVIIGGKGRRNEKNADRFARLAIEASNVVAEAEPQLSLRFYDGQDPSLMAQALDVIGQGKVYPMLYNDEVNIPSVMAAFQVSRQDAEDYCFFGCGEYVINKKSIGSPNGIINLLKALEVTLFNGRDLCDGKQTGLALGSLTDYPTFDALLDAYHQQLTYQFDILARQEKMEYDYCASVGAYLFITMLMDDCLERNRSLLGGGVRYLGGTLETYGNINTTNSLYAIRKTVYEDKSISPQTLLDALKANFKGYERELHLLRSAEKYGNDLDGVDSFAQELHQFICTSVRDLKDKVGLHSYMIVMINNEANTILGRFTGASADGRLAFEPMANANNPAGGTDCNGVTAMLNSLVKLRTDIHAGAVQNMTFSREMFQKNRKIVEALLQGYFKSGGAQAMINVLNRGDLEDAMVHPERHQNLMVRVGGFSARFVTLAPDVQREIASRTLY